jgi:hypothetical protein
MACGSMEDAFYPAGAGFGISDGCRRSSVFG